MYLSRMVSPFGFRRSDHEQTAADHPKLHQRFDELEVGMQPLTCKF